jgi:hypothetical protein
MRFSKNMFSMLCFVWALQPFHLSAQNLRENEIFSLDLDKSGSFLESLGMEYSPIEGGVLFTFPESEHSLFVRKADSEAVVSEIEDRLLQESEDLADFFDGSKVAAALPVYDVSELIDELLEQNIAFLGPVVGTDGVYQLFVLVPAIGYIDFYSSKMPDQDHIGYVEIWEQVLDGVDPSQILIRTPTVGTPIGEAFNSVDANDTKDFISLIQVTWGANIQSLSLGYRSGREVSYGYYHGPQDERVILDEGEVIIDGFVCEDNANLNGDKLIKYMMLLTSSGRQLSFGEISNECLMFNIPQDHMVEGFFGHFENYLNQLGAVYTPVI